MNLRVNYAETVDTGNQVTSKGSEFHELLNKVKSINDKLKAYWEGGDAATYSAAVEEEAKTMDALAQTIDEIGGYLVKVGNAYEEAMEQNKSAIQQ